MALTSYAESASGTSWETSDRAVTIDGIRLFAGARAEALAHCLSLIRNGTGGRVATANLDFFAIARKDPQLKVDLDESSLVIIDGAPIAWLARAAGAATVERYAGVDLVRDLCASASEAHPLRVAVLGSTAEVAGPAVKALGAASGQVEFVFVEHPPFRPLTPEEVGGYKQALRASGPNLVLVALGCPRQERLIAEWSDAAADALWIGVGGTLDFFAGRRKRAPGWAQRFGMEWIVRMAQDPKRLAGRYLLRDIPALARIAPATVSKRFTRRKPASN